MSKLTVFWLMSELSVFWLMVMQHLVIKICNVEWKERNYLRQRGKNHDLKWIHDFVRFNKKYSMPLYFFFVVFFFFNSNGLCI